MPIIKTKEGKKKEFSYTKSGIAAAKKAAIKPGAKIIKKKRRTDSGYMMSK